MKNKNTFYNVVLFAVSMVLSRTAFLLIDDPEGPNLLIVTVFAVVIFATLSITFKILRKFGVRIY